MGALSSVERFNLRYLTWVRAAPLAARRYYSQALAVPGGASLLVLGGSGDQGVKLGSAERYDPAADAWRTAGTGMAAARAFFVAVGVPAGWVEC